MDRAGKKKGTVRYELGENSASNWNFSGLGCLSDWGAVQPRKIAGIRDGGVG